MKDLEDIYRDEPSAPTVDWQHDPTDTYEMERQWEQLADWKKRKWPERFGEEG